MFRSAAAETNAGTRRTTMAKKFPIDPAHPERTCWGCDKYCPAHEMQCGNGSDRTMHPVETFGPGWEEWGLDPVVPPGTLDKPRFVIPIAPVKA